MITHNELDAPNVSAFLKSQVRNANLSSTFIPESPCPSMQRIMSFMSH